MYLFLIPLLLGFALDCVSAATTALSRRWGERSGRLATLILRALGIVVWAVGLFLAARAPSPTLYRPGLAAFAVIGVLVSAGAALIGWALLALRRRAAMPSIEDDLEEGGPYAYVRHPLYSGVVLEFVALAVRVPSATTVVACALGVAWLQVQARLEERDLLQRIPLYRQYMQRVPRFVPRLKAKGGRGCSGR